MPILPELRRRTRAQHERLESCVDLERRCRTRAGYTALLACFYGFYAPVEARVAAAIPPPRFDVAQRRKTPLLLRDLGALLDTHQVNDIPRCDAPPPLDTLPEAIGCLYVMEGATLGGQIIARHAQQVLGLDAQNGAAFFHSYGPQVGRMWRDFCRDLEEYAADAPTQEAVIRSAADTFAALERWLYASPIPPGS